VLGDRDVDGVVALQQPLGVDDREPDDLAAVVEAQYMPLGRGLAVGGLLALAGVQVEDVYSGSLPPDNYILLGTDVVAAHCLSAIRIAFPRSVLA
jgi:hypothetical protein